MGKNKLRSRLVTLAALLSAVAIGGLLGYLSRDAEPSHTPQSLSLPAGTLIPNSNLRAALEPRLEYLIATEQEVESVGAKALLRTLALASRRDDETASWISSRLADPDVPEVLLHELLGEMGTEPQGKKVVTQIVTERLGSHETRLQQQGLRLVRALRIAKVRTSGPCRCQAGVFPEDFLPDQPRFFVAWASDAESGIQWSPEPNPRSKSEWSLNLEAIAPNSSARALVQRVPSSARPAWLKLETEAGPRLRLQVVD